MALLLLPLIFTSFSLAVSSTTDNPQDSSSMLDKNGNKKEEQKPMVLRKAQRATPFGQIQEVPVDPVAEKEEDIDRTLKHLLLSTSYEYFSYSYTYYPPTVVKFKSGKSSKSSKSKGKGGKSSKSSKGGYVYIAEDDDHYHHAVSGMSPPAYYSKVGVIVDDDRYFGYSTGKGKGGKSSKSSKSKGKGGKSSKSSKGGYVYIAEDDDHYHHAVSGVSPPAYYSKVGVIVDDDHYYFGYNTGKGKGGKSSKSSKSKGKGGKSSKSSKGGYVYIAEDDDHYPHAVSGLSPPGIVVDDDDYIGYIKVGKSSKGKGKGGKSSKSSKSKGKGRKSSKSERGYAYHADDDYHYSYRRGYSKKN